MPNPIISSLEPLPGGTYRLIGIDNDHAFVPPLVKEGGKTVQIKSILYCLDQYETSPAPICKGALSLLPT